MHYLLIKIYTTVGIWYCLKVKHSQAYLLTHVIITKHTGSILQQGPDVSIRVLIHSSVSTTVAFKIHMQILFFENCVQNL